MELYYPSAKFKSSPGLRSEGTEVFLDGEPFAGIGVNYYGAVINEYYEPEKGELKEVLERLRANGIRYFRANVGFFYPVNLRDYLEDEEKWFSVFDRVVRSCEEYGIGMIFSFFWNTSGYNDYFREPISAWGDGNSRTRRFMKYYVQKVVSRYKESPAVWMWQFGNELNLQVDLPNRKELRAADNRPPLQLGLAISHGEDDFWFSDIATPLWSDFAKLCRTFDPYGRMISTGNAEPRPKAYGVRAYDLWRDKPDSAEETAKVLEWQNPDPVDCVEIHSYGIEDRWDGSFDSYEKQFGMFKDLAARIGKPLFVGEFNGLSCEASEEQMDAIVKLRVPLSAIWAIGKVEYTLDGEPEVRDRVLAYAAKCNSILCGKK